jgi:hypothetical protein
MAYKFQRGEAILSGALLQEGNVEIESGFEFSMHDELVLDTSRNLTVAGMSGSGDLQVGGDVRLDGVAEEDAEATDRLYFLDADGFMKSDAIEDVRDSLIFASVSGDATIAAGGALTIAAGAVENDMLAGDIANAKLVNDSVTVTAGAALSGGGEVELGASINLDVEVHASGGIEIVSDALQIKEAGVTNDMLSGSIASSKIAELDAFDTDDLGEGSSNLYYTEARWDTKMAAADTDDLAEGASNLYFTDARAQAALSVTDAGGDGSLAYDDSTGVFTYTGPSAAEVRAHFSAGEMLQVSDGEFSIVSSEFSGSWADVLATKDTGDLAEGSNLYYTEARWDSKMAAADTDDLSEGSSNLYYTDDRVFAALSVSDSNSIAMTYDAAGDFSAALRISGSQLEVTGDGLRLAAGSVDGTTMELSDDSLSVLAVPHALSQGEGIATFSFDGSSDVTIGLDSSVAGDGLAYSSGVLSLDLDELTAADVAVGADFIAIVDADDNSTKKESIADLVAAMAGAGLTADSGQLSVTGNDVHLKANSGTLQEGYNYFADIAADGTASVTLPASPSNGDVVHVKAGDLGENAYITIDRAGSQTIDGETFIELESPFAAVSLVYIEDLDAWRIV